MKQAFTFVLTKVRGHVLGAATLAERYQARGTHYEDQGYMARAFFWQGIAMAFGAYSLGVSVLAWPWLALLRRMRS